MKKIWKWIIVAIVAIALGIYILIRTEHNYFNKVELNQNNYVKNVTNMVYLDTVLSVGLDVLEIKNVIIFVRPLTFKRSDSEFTLKARIISANLSQGMVKQYLIEINKSNKSDIITSVSHELIHLKQYQLGILKVTEDYVIWKGDTLIDNIPEYEKEAKIYNYFSSLYNSHKSDSSRKKEFIVLERVATFLGLD